MNIYVAGDYGVGYAYWLLDFYKEAIITRDILEADLIMFTGGADISPSIYGEKISRTYWGNEHRDKVEIEVFKKAVELDIPMIGICRGLQLICGLCGGRVIQDVSNHAECSHNITFKDGFQCVTTSLHHQMVYPFELPKENYSIEAWSTERRSTKYINGEDEQYSQIPPVESEVVLFFKDKYNNPVKCLGIQGHPEMMKIGEFHKRLIQLIDNNLLNK